VAGPLIVFLVAKYLFLLQPGILPYYFMLTTNIAALPAEALRLEDMEAVRRIDRSRNAVWLEHRWLQDGVTEEEIAGLCRRLKENHIRYVYPHLSPADNDGRLPPFSQQAARLFRRIVKREAPDVQILPWVGGVKTGFRQTQEGTVALDSDSYLQTFAGECVFLTRDLGFDGIHLNIEPMDSGNSRLPEWLDYLKTRLEGKTLSIAANKPSFLEGFNVSPERSWDVNYFAQIGRKCDQLVIMSYDTGLSQPFLYSLFVQEKISAILKRFDHERLPCKILLGVPTYDEAPRHNVNAENIPSALKGLLSALSVRNMQRGSFEGIALYGYWTTSEEEWKQFANGWLNH
jgi:hypothetical protein